MVLHVFRGLLWLPCWEQAVDRTASKQGDQLGNPCIKQVRANGGLGQGTVSRGVGSCSTVYFGSRAGMTDWSWGYVKGSPPKGKSLRVWASAFERGLPLTEKGIDNSGRSRDILEERYQKINGSNVKSRHLLDIQAYVSNG